MMRTRTMKLGDQEIVVIVDPYDAHTILRGTRPAHVFIDEMLRDVEVIRTPFHLDDLLAIAPLAPAPALPPPTFRSRALGLACLVAIAPTWRSR